MKNLIAAMLAATSLHAATAQSQTEAATGAEQMSAGEHHVTPPADQAEPTPVASRLDYSTNPDVGVPVFPFDITDRPYQVLGEVKAKVRKATIFSKDPSQKKIYDELWERGQKLGADAVIKAQYGDAHVTAFSWGSSTATGTAIKFADSK